MSTRAEALDASDDRLPSGRAVRTVSPRPILTQDQSRALAAIEDARGFQPVLLHGVTGSGKTEIYIRAAETLPGRGKTSLILVPEIGLTPQLTDRFAERFPGRRQSSTAR